MASKEYSTVSYHATKDDAEESIPEVLLDNAKDRENSEGNGDFFLHYEKSYITFHLIRKEFINCIF